jgi:hypothetical protein
MVLDTVNGQGELLPKIETTFSADAKLGEMLNITDI